MFSPLQVGPLELRTRGWVPAMVPWRATEDGEVTREVLDWYARFAEGRPGAIVVEATGIRDIPSGPLLRAGHDRFLPGLRQLVETVREASEGQTRLLIQLIDFLRIRRRPEREAYLSRFLTVTDAHRDALQLEEEGDVRAHLLTLADDELRFVLSEREWEALAFGARERVTDTHLEAIEELPRVLPRLFADASARAQDAGFDGVELHFAHAYTMASFLSRTNTRRDGYGGDLEGRARLPLEVFAAVREKVGSEYAIGCRFLGDEVIEGGNRIADAVHFGRAFAAAGMDFLSISKGGKFDDAKQPRVGEAAYPYTGPSGHECMPTVRIDERGPFGRNLPLAKEVRDAIRADGLTTPVVAAGGIGTFREAEEALERGDCDLVGAARQSLADPDWWRKMELGRGAEVRRCIYTNYCEGLDQRHKEVTCQLWDRVQSEQESPPMSQDGKRRLTPPPWNP